MLKKYRKNNSQNNSAIKRILISCPPFGIEIRTAKIPNRPVKLQSVIADNFLEKPALTKR